jgi:Cu(I)/Ag(I) efflux system membrane fusion protein
MKNIIIVIGLSTFLLACTKKNNQDSSAAHDHPKEASNTKHQVAPSHDLMLNDSQIQLANITTQPVRLQSIGQTVIVNGRVLENEELSEVISSRAAGRIEKLFIKETGKLIRKGEPLYQLYSESLLTLQREFLLAKEQFETIGATEKRYKSFYDGARKKLLLYGLTDRQVEKLEQSKQVQPSVTFLSPATGIITDINTTDGQYIAEGEILMTIDNISKLWVEAELYPTETALAKIGDNISIKISGFENTPMEGTINFMSPEYRANSQVTVMRASLSNPDQVFKPGMQAQIFFTHSSKQALALPADAVIRDGHGAHVYVQRGRNTFRAQRVKTGLEDFQKIEITEGIHKDDTVAITGAYLLYSEMVLKKGIDPMASHQH